MDVMDNFHSGKYTNPVVMVDGFGWCRKTEGGYRRASMSEYQAKKKEIVQNIKQDLLAEVELDDCHKASNVFDITLEHVGVRGVPATVSCFRALAEVIR